VALGYSDGPTNGILECEGDGYKFDMLDGDDLRFYSLAPLPPDSVADFVRTLAPFQQPRWPVWCPLWSFSSETIRQNVEQETDRILGRAGPVEWVVATEDLHGEIVAARRLRADKLGTVKDWYAFLGLNRQPPWVASVGAAS